MNNPSPDEQWLYSPNSYEPPNPYANREDVSTLSRRPSQPLAEGYDDSQARLAAYLIAQQLTRPQGGSQAPLTVNISNSFNTTDSHNRKLRYHQSQLERRPEKFSRVVPGLFVGFWLISIMVLLMSGGNDGR